jgi:hypothetical protein
LEAIHAEPGFAGTVEQQRAASLQHRRADRTRAEHFDRKPGVDAAALGE